MTGEARTEAILRPIMGRPSRRWFIVLAIALAGLAWYAQAWAFQLQHGMIGLGIGDWGSGGGIPWGLYVGSFIWWVGIALLISGIVNDEVTKQAESCRADGVLKKPFQGTSLKDRVFELLAKKQESSPVARSSATSVPGTAAESSLPMSGQPSKSEPQEANHLRELERQLQVERTRSEELTDRLAALTAQLVRAKEIESQLTMERQQVSDLQQTVTILERQAARIPELEAAFKSEQDVVNSLKQALLNSQATSSRVAELESSLEAERAAAEQLVQQLADLITY